MTDAALVDRIARIAPKVIHRAYERAGTVPLDQCCLLGRVCHDALHLLDVASEPLDCFATAWNAKFNDWLKTGVTHPDAYRHTNDPRVMQRSGVAPTTTMNSHVVIHVPSTSQIVDLAAWQLSRPRQGILLPSAIVLPWTGEKALFESATGWVGYRWCDPSLFALPPPFPQRPEWVKGEIMAWLAKMIAKRVRR